MKMIELENVTKDYGNGRGVFGVTFSVEEGEVLGFLGPNGAGKTTTIRQLMGFLRPDSGTARIGGKDCFRKAGEIKRSLGYLPGEIAFPEGMRGEEFLRFMGALRGEKSPGRTGELKERFELDASGPISRMSKGTKQKIGIVCAFQHDPDVILLDEPTSGLDPLMQGRFIELVLEERKRGKTILMSSHVFEETERTCGRAAIIRGGRLAGVEDMERLRRDRARHWEVVFADGADAAAFGRRFPEARVDGTRAEITWTGEADALIKTLAGSRVADLSARPETLEELFLSYYEKGGAAR